MASPGADELWTFGHFDGDRVGSRLELLLLDGNSLGASEYSRALKDALDDVESTLRQIEGVTIIISGGDDLVAMWPPGAVTRDDLENCRQKYLTRCGQTLSAGLGRSSREALQTLHRAKLLGGNQVVVCARTCW